MVAQTIRLAEENESDWYEIDAETFAGQLYDGSERRFEGGNQSQPGTFRTFWAFWDI